MIIFERRRRIKQTKEKTRKQTSNRKGILRTVF
jgi:hypothetical protein